MSNKSKKIRLIFFFYWILLAYIIAALVWWYIALSQQNNQMTTYKLHRLKADDPNYTEQFATIQDEERRKKAQYIGEGAIFMLLIMTGAIFVYRAVSKQFRISQQQQHFMMAVTHELKTPIAVTRLNLETLQKRKLDEGQQQKLLSNTLEEADRMNTLCNNLLLSSQIEAGGYRITAEAFDMGELTEACIQEFATRFPQKPFHTAINGNNIITGDQILMRMAINNLLDNAVKYSSRESPVTIRTIQGNGNLTIEIADEGQGVEEVEKKKIFEKFYRVGNEATRKAKGTGLGLYLVQKIIQAHHGKIFVKDNQPKGCIFSVSLKQDV